MSEPSMAVIGLDIGSASVKCVELSRQKDGVLLHRMAVLPIEQSSAASAVKNLKIFLEEKPAALRHVRVAVKGPSLIIRRVDLPRMTHAELKSAIRFEAEGQLPFAIDDCALDFQILDETSDGKRMNVLLVAAKKDLIEQRLNLLAEAEIKPELIDADVLCLINAFQALGGKGESTYGLLNIGHEISSFAIVRENLPFLIREVSFEGLEPLVKDLTQSINFFENESGEALKTIWLSGGGAAAEGVSGILSTALDRQVALWDNSGKVELSSAVDPKQFQAHRHTLNIALGLGLRGLGGQK